MKVHGPDGRVWAVTRRPDPPGLLGLLLPRGRWVVEATTDDEIRRWAAASRWAASDLVGDVALALRTGAEGPSGELPPDQPSDQQQPADEGEPSDQG